MKKLGLCLSGGGARGAYEIGVVAALEELGKYQHVQAISGTSIGAANASILGSNTIDAAKNLWFDMPLNPIGEFSTIRERIKENKFNIVDAGIYTMEIFEKILMEGIQFDQFNQTEVFVTISESGASKDNIFHLIPNTYNHYFKKQSKVKYVKLNDVDKDLAVKCVKASCSIPLAFSSIELEGKKYYDGGVYDNAPITPLLEAGCDEIIFVNISFLNQSKKLIKDLNEITVHEIKSKRNLGQVLDFKREHAQKIFEYGYQDTMEYFKDIELVLE